MSDHLRADLPEDRWSRIVRPYQPLPPWLERRLLGPDEHVTWVRGPRFNPSWERYVTHPILFLVALALGAVSFAAGGLGAEAWSGMPVVGLLTAGGLVIGSIMVLAFFNGYFTRLVVTDRRIVILQGYEVCRSWSMDRLPRSLIRYGTYDDGAARRLVDLDALQSLLGGSSDQFVDAKAIQALGKQIDRIRASEDG